MELYSDERASVDSGKFPSPSFLAKYSSSAYSVTLTDESVQLKALIKNSMVSAYLHIDAGKVDQVVRNLITNAV